MSSPSARFSPATDPTTSNSVPSHIPTAVVGSSPNSRCTLTSRQARDNTTTSVTTVSKNSAATAAPRSGSNIASSAMENIPAPNPTVA
jgi:hypothetical protein